MFEKYRNHPRKDSLYPCYNTIEKDAWDRVDFSIESYEIKCRKEKKDSCKEAKHGVYCAAVRNEIMMLREEITVIENDTWDIAYEKPFIRYQKSFWREYGLKKHLEAAFECDLDLKISRENDRWLTSFHFDYCKFHRLPTKYFLLMESLVKQNLTVAEILARESPLPSECWACNCKHHVAKNCFFLYWVALITDPNKNDVLHRIGYFTELFIKK